MQSEAYNNDYFNIQDIMASQERVSCKFDIDIPHMGRNLLIFFNIKMYSSSFRHLKQVF